MSIAFSYGFRLTCMQGLTELLTSELGKIWPRSPSWKTTDHHLIYIVKKQPG